MPSITDTHQGLVGTWTLAEYKTVQDDTGHVSYPLGKDAQGFIVYTPDGFVSVNMMRPGAPAFSSNDITRGTVEESAEALRHYLAYCGRFELNEIDGQVVAKHNMEVCSFPNWLGDWQQRVVNLNGDELVLSTANSYVVDGHNVHGALSWRKSQPLAV